MPITTSTLWGAQDPQAVALLQNVTNAAKVIINGKAADPVNHTMSFLNLGYRRNISITSASNNAASSSVILGYVNGLLLSEVVVNPNNSTVYSTNIFDKIVSITITGADATNITYGTGDKGYVFLPTSILSGSEPQPSVQVIIMGDNINYTVYYTLDKSIIGNGNSFESLIDNGTFLTSEEYTGLEESVIVANSFTLLLNSYIVKINNSNSTTSLKIIYMQL